MAWSARSTRWQPGDYAIDERFRIEATVLRADGSASALLPERGGRGPWRPGAHDPVEVDVSGSHLATYVADAVVVATPTGSTAYSSARRIHPGPTAAQHDHHAGGAYLTSLHSVVAGEEHVVIMSLRSAGSGAVVSIDGQWDLALATGDRVEVRALAARCA
jgi:NAD+ kinase